MEMYNIHEAKTKLSQLIEQVESGQEILIARAGKPAAKLVPFVKSGVKREAGAWRGQVKMAEDFDRTSDEVIAAFEGADS
jgi:prevent-host-death family protein